MVQYSEPDISMSVTLISKYMDSLMSTRRSGGLRGTFQINRKWQTTHKIDFYKKSIFLTNEAHQHLALFLEGLWYVVEKFEIINIIFYVIEQGRNICLSFEYGDGIYVGCE